MKENTPLPTDIYSLKKAGIDQLRDMKWPVSDDEYLSLVSEYREAYEKVLLALNPELRGVLIADFSFVGFLSQVSHAQAVLGRVEKEGGRVEVGPLAQPFYFPEWKAQGKIKPHEFQGSRVRSRLKGLAKDLKFNNHLGVLGRVTGSRQRVLGVGSFTRLKEEYVRKRGLYVQNRYLRNLLPLELGKSELPQALVSAAEEIVSRLDEAFRDRFGFELHLVEDAAFCWKQRLGRLYIAFESLAACRDLPEEVLVSETAKPFHKAIAASFRKAGSQAVGFHHGNSMGALCSETYAYNELSAYDVFVCPTRACADAYAETYAACRISRHARLTVATTDTSYYEQLHRSMARESIPKRINSVMLMGFPMNASRYHQEGVGGLFFFFQFELEMRLARLLRQNGYRVLYKIHPDRQGGIRELMEPLCDEIVTAPFEQCWKKADAILSKYTGSSTFGFALCTNRPIVLLDNERSLWRSDHYEALKRRCRMVQAWIQDSRIEFDKNSLIRALKRKPQPPDGAYVRNFMCSRL